MNNTDIKQLLSGKTANWNNILVEDKLYRLYNKKSKSKRNAIVCLYITYYEHLPILIPILNDIVI